MQLDFLTPRVERLRSDGAFEAIHSGGLLGRLRQPVLLLARDLCAFSLFETATLPRDRRRQAARLYARAASPYITSGAALVKCGADFGVWWWDLERTSPLLEDRYGSRWPVLRPETLAQPRGTSWRIVRLHEGYEAQLWRDSGLMASAWRGERYDGSSWSIFTRLQRGADAPPEAPPAPQTVPIAFNGEAFSWAQTEMSRGQALGMALGGAALVVTAAVTFLIGQGLQLSSERQAVELEVAEIRRSTPQADGVRALELDRRILTTYRQIEEQTNPVSAAGAAIGIVAFHNLTPIALEAAEQTLTLTLPYAAVRNSEELISEFETSGYFYDVRPRTDAASQTLIMEMKTREAAPPLTGAG